MECPFNTSAVIVTEFSDTFNHILQVAVSHRCRTKDHLPFWEPALGETPKVHYDLQQFASVIEPIDRSVDVWRKCRQQSLQIVSDHMLHRQFYHLIIFWRELTVPRPFKP